MKIAVATDSNSGITRKDAKELSAFVLPMPFIIDGNEFFEEINLSQEEFYQKLEGGADVHTSQPSPEALKKFWDDILKDFDYLVYIPMSSGLSGSCQTASMLAEDYDGRVEVVNNQRISVTQRSSVIDALRMVSLGYDAAGIKRILEEDRFNSSIYIMIGTLEYLKKGGRLTPAVAAIGNLLKIKPILQIQGEKLDAFAVSRTVSGGKQTMINAVKKDCINRFGGLDPDNVEINIAYSHNVEAGMEFLSEIKAAFSGFDIYSAPLSLSVSCHIGPNSLAITATKKLKTKEV
ncbi:MAG: DegV family protein [Lachnospiraceae bacterium]|nr:DegV family protein [Lachnospiraceae bacterium]